MWKFKVLKNLFLLSVVFYCVCLLSVHRTKAQVVDDFETYEPGTELNGQGVWHDTDATTTLQISLQNQYNYWQSLKLDSGTKSAITRTFGTIATTSEMTQCAYIFLDSDEFDNYNEELIFGLSASNNRSYESNQAYLKLVNKNIYYWKGWTGGAMTWYDTGLDTTTRTWHLFCLEILNKKMRYTIDDYVSAWIDNVNDQNFTTDEVHFEAHYLSYGDHDVIYVDTLDATSTPEQHIIVDGSIEWNFPKNGWVLNNSEWNDWELDINMNEQNIGKWNVLMVHYTDVNGKTGTDWDLITTTTDGMSWTINRSYDFPDGLTNSQAEIVSIDDCDNYWEDNCVWTDQLKTEIIEWTASSTGYTKFDNPYELPGFFPASTTASSTEQAGWIGQIWNRMKNVFPLSIGFQLQNTIKNISIAGNSETQLNIPLNSILPSAMASQIASSVTLISSSTLTTGLPFFATTIYPTIEWIVYGLFVVLIIYIMWPRAKQATS